MPCRDRPGGAFPFQGGDMMTREEKIAFTAVMATFLLGFFLTLVT